MLRTKIGFVFQQYNLVPFLTVEENIKLPFQLSREKYLKTLLTSS